jgi:phosphoribosylcarboxyaminoimidazole (NCAIR) mutase
VKNSAYSVVCVGRNLVATLLQLNGQMRSSLWGKLASSAFRILSALYCKITFGLTSNHRIYHLVVNEAPARVAQSVERVALMTGFCRHLKVVGSSPTSGSIPVVPLQRGLQILFCLMLFFLMPLSISQE